MREVAIVINARMASSRLPNKLIRYFAYKSLIGYALEKLSAIHVKEKYLAAYDPEILSVYESSKTNVGLLLRSPESVAKGQVPHRIAFQHYESVKSPYILVMNPCHPLTSTQTYEKAIQFFQDNPEIASLTSVRKKVNLFFDENKRLLNQSNETEVKTHNQSPIYEMAHAFHVFPRDRFLETGKLWDYQQNDPVLYEVSKMEALDVDDEEDFFICDAVFRSQYGAQLHV